MTRTAETFLARLDENKDSLVYWLPFLPQFADEILARARLLCSLLPFTRDEDGSFCVPVVMDCFFKVGHTDKYSTSIQK